MRRAFVRTGLAAALLAAGPLMAQDVESVCRNAPASTPTEARNACVAVAQAVDAAQPQLGILMAGGNPTLGTASTGGVRLGIIPRFSLTGRVNVVGARLPDITQIDPNAGGGSETDQFSVPAPALGANVSLGLTNGFSVAPLLGGFGAIDLLGSVTVLPLSLIDEFDDNAVSWGAGARVALMRESFVTPGVSVSLMYRDMGELKYGDVCEGDPPQDGPDTECANTDGDDGEIRFGLSNWSARAAVSKRLLGLGLTAGVGYDRFESDADLAVRSGTSITRFRDVSVDNDRWSAFVDASYTVLVGSLVGEVGWMQGGDAISGFSGEFDPGQGTWFGSVGARLSL